MTEGKFLAPSPLDKSRLVNHMLLAICRRDIYTQARSQLLGDRVMAKKVVNEHRYYNIVKEALENEFAAKGYLRDFEVTGHPGRPNLPERFLEKNPVLFKYRRSLPTPDIMGLVWRRGEEAKRLVIAEFRMKPTFLDIFQTKGYDELFNSDYSYRVSVYPISESSKSGSTMAFVRDNRKLLMTKEGQSAVVVRFLHRTTDGAVVFAFLGSEPELVGPGDV